MAPDSVTRERILNLFLNKVCWFLSQKQKDALLKRVNDSLGIHPPIAPPAPHTPQMPPAAPGH